MLERKASDQPIYIENNRENLSSHLWLVISKINSNKQFEYNFFSDPTLFCDNIYLSSSNKGSMPGK